MTRVKICGVTTPENALMVAQAGADLIGLNFYPASPRAVTPQQAAMIAASLRAALGENCPVLVGVFVNAAAAAVLEILDSARLDAAQLSGDEGLEVLAALGGRGFKSLRPRAPEEAAAAARLFLPAAPDDQRLPALLLDAYHPGLYGGTGEQAGAEIVQAVAALTPRLMLAGGLTPANVGERVAALRPWGVDTASGVESVPGVKDPARVAAFIAAVRQASG